MDALPPIPDTAERRQPLIDGALAAIRQSDPGFDRDAFCGAAERRFPVLLDARRSGRLEPLASWIDPELAAAWRDEDARLAGLGVQKVLEGVRVMGSRLMWAEAEGPLQRLLLGVDGLAAARTVRIDTGQVVDGSDAAQETQYWLLSRPAGTQSVPAAGECPTCGAPPAERDICAYCRMPLPGPLSGWVLKRSDRELVWAPSAAEDPRPRPDDDDFDPLKVLLRGR